MNTNRFLSFKERESTDISASAIETLLEDGWILLDIRHKRTTEKDGSFEDVAIYSLAHELGGK